jgi:HPt (histidine-containing phosphotransfer) domain-containing protein
MSEILDKKKIETLKTELGKDIFEQLVNIYAAELSTLLLQLEQSINLKIPDSINYAHSIKGISSNIGALAIKEIASQIEKLVMEFKYGETTIFIGELKLTAHQTIKQLQKEI